MAENSSFPLISSFLSLPDEVLLTEVFPRLPIDNINELCSTNIRFYNICQNDILWQIKTFNEFPTWISQKLPDILWRDYYRLLISGKSIPIYYHGDRIGYVPFSDTSINIVISLITPYIVKNQLNGAINITFIDQGLNPIIIVKYPSLKTNVKSANYNSIEKVVLIINDDFSKEPTPSRGRNRKPIITNKEKEEQRDKNIIYDELTSSFGHPPIYGFNYNPNNIRTGYRALPSKITGEASTFAIIDNRNLKDLRIIRRGKVCSTFSTVELYDILRNLNVPDLEVERYSKTQLCNIIKHALDQIGHII